MAERSVSEIRRARCGGHAIGGRSAGARPDAAFEDPGTCELGPPGSLRVEAAA